MIEEHSGPVQNLSKGIGPPTEEQLSVPSHLQQRHKHVSNVSTCIRWTAFMVLLTVLLDFLNKNCFLFFIFSACGLFFPSAVNLASVSISWHFAPNYPHPAVFLAAFHGFLATQLESCSPLELKGSPRRFSSARLFSFDQSAVCSGRGGGPQESATLVIWTIRSFQPRLSLWKTTAPQLSVSHVLGGFLMVYRCVVTVRTNLLTKKKKCSFCKNTVRRLSLMTAERWRRKR